MSDSKDLYRRNNSKQQQRIGEFANVEDPTKRKHEIAVCRTLIEEVLQNGNVSTANALLNTLDRLQKNEFRRQVIESELLSRQAIRRFMDQVVETLAQVIPQHLEAGWEDCLIEISENLDNAFDELRNDTKGVEGIKLPRKAAIRKHRGEFRGR